MPLASRGRDHWKEAEVLVMAVTVKLTGGVDSGNIRARVNMRR